MGALELSKHPPNEGLGKFLAPLSLPGEQVQHSVQTWCVSAGVMVWLLGGPSQSRYHFYPLAPRLPLDGARQPATAAQLAALLPVQSAWVTNNQPVMMHICVSVCRGRRVLSRSLPLSSLNKTAMHVPLHTQVYEHASNCMHTKKTCCCSLQKARAVLNLDDQLSSVCKGLTRVCSKSQSTLPNFGVKMISAKQNHTHKNWAACYMVARNFICL